MSSKTTDLFRLLEFIRESNRIEGIYRDPVDQELEAHIEFLKLEKVAVADLETFVETIQPTTTRLRKYPGMNVQVGNHFPPQGGPQVVADLENLLDYVNVPDSNAYAAHHRYETLHPFMDGNGRSGRVLWLWMHKRDSPGLYARALRIGFLHSWYYESLEESRIG